jgi:hypothetical protein
VSTAGIRDEGNAREEMRAFWEALVARDGTTRGACTAVGPLRSVRGEWEAVLPIEVLADAFPGAARKRRRPRTYLGRHSSRSAALDALVDAALQVVSEKVVRECAPEEDLGLRRGADDSSWLLPSHADCIVHRHSGSQWHLKTEGGEWGGSGGSYAVTETASDDWWVRPLRVESAAATESTEARRRRLPLAVAQANVTILPGFCCSEEEEPRDDDDRVAVAEADPDDDNDPEEPFALVQWVVEPSGWRRAFVLVAESGEGDCADLHAAPHVSRGLRADGKKTASVAVPRRPLPTWSVPPKCAAVMFVAIPPDGKSILVLLPPTTSPAGLTCSVPPAAARAAFAAWQARGGAVGVDGILHWPSQTVEAVWHVSERQWMFYCTSTPAGVRWHALSPAQARTVRAGSCPEHPVAVTATIEAKGENWCTRAPWMLGRLPTLTLALLTLIAACHQAAIKK